jgi:hypothetical protein
MPVQALIYLPNVGKSVSRVREFRRCPAHGNLLSYQGRALDVDEFNKIAPNVLGNATTYGMQPMVKLVGDNGVVPAPPEKTADVGKASDVATKPELPQAGGLIIEPLNDGFVVVDLRGESALYRGTGEGWESEIGLVAPFASVEDAAAAVPDATKPIPAEEVVAPLVVETAPVEVETPPPVAAPAAPKAPKAPKAQKKVKVIQVSPPDND